MNMRILLPGILLVLCLAPAAAAQMVVPNDQGIDARADAEAIAARLGSKDAIERQKAAEALATLAAVSQKKLLEGYRLQEKDKAVRLALDWALFRIGKTQLLYQIVRELDSGRHDQAVGYLSQLDSPLEINGLLNRELNQPRVTVGLLEILARIGNSESLELVKPFRDSFASGVAHAAEFATDEIEKRLGESGTSLPGRPRTVGTAEKTTP